MTPVVERLGRPRWGWELTLVAALALGQSAVYALVRLIDISTRGPLTEAQARKVAQEQHAQAVQAQQQEQKKEGLLARWVLGGLTGRR